MESSREPRIRTLQGLADLVPLALNYTASADHLRLAQVQDHAAFCRHLRGTLTHDEPLRVEGLRLRGAVEAKVLPLSCLE